MKDQYYLAKLLLLGEHIVLKGAQALATPLPLYGGRWQFAPGEPLLHPLDEFVNYVKKLAAAGDLRAAIDVARLDAAVAQGWQFKANIPIGYGLGSSGAFVAAVYDQFCTARTKTTNFAVLKTELAQLEDYFHNASSGTDPLICYLNQPVLITPGVGIATTTLPLANGAANYTLFLLDTKIPRKTAPFVEHFLENCTEEVYLKRCLSELIPASNDAVAAFLQAQWAVFFELLHEISFFQFKYFPKMIPGAFRQIWLEGLSGNNFKLKLCGAGGGGFILGMTRDFAKMERDYPLQSFVKVYAF